MKLEDQVVSPSGRKLRGGGYGAIHKWLLKNFGKATKCENKACDGKSKAYQWALKRSKQYEHNRDNFFQLCASCHRIYDITVEQIRSQSAAIRGRKYSDEHRKKISESMKGKNKGESNGRWKGGKYAT